MGQKALILSLQPFLSHVAICAWPHERAIFVSSVSTVLRQVILGPPGLLLPAGVHLRATLRVLSGGMCSMCPSNFRAAFYFSSYIVAPSLAVELSVRHYFGPKYPTDPAQTTIVESTDPAYIPLCHSATLCIIKQNRLDQSFDQPDFGFEAVDVGFLYMIESCEGAACFSQSSLYIFLCAFVMTDQTS